MNTFLILKDNYMKLFEELFLEFEELLGSIIYVLLLLWLLFC